MLSKLSKYNGSQELFEARELYLETNNGQLTSRLPGQLFKIRIIHMPRI